MAGLNEENKWEVEVYQIEENDPVQGGKSGITNKPTRQLANRTVWLKKLLEALGKNTAPKKLSSSTKNEVEEDGHTHEIEKASLSQAGLVQLSNDDNSDDETKAPTLKVIKKLKGLYDGISRSLNNYIPNSKKSNAIDSNSGDTVATSSAVKTAYDKANQADKNANNRVAKSGDTMTGDLEIKSSKWSAVKLFNQDNHYLRVEVVPHSASNFGTLIYHNGTEILHRLLMPKKSGTIATTDEVNTCVAKSAISDAVNSDSQTNVASSRAVKMAYDKAVDGVNRADNAQNTANNAQIKANQADNNANGRVSKSGDVIQWLNIQRDHAWLSIISESNASTGIDFTNWKGKAAQATLEALDIGNYGVEFRMHTTPKGDNYNSDRRRHTFTFNPEGHIWSLGYGWLHDYFVKKSGDRMTGDLELKSNDWSSVKLFNTTNHYLRLEVAPDRDPNFGCLIYHDGRNLLHRLLLPKKTGTLATVDDIKSTYRKDYSRTINGTSTWDNGTSKSIQLDGSVTVYPDGRIVQVLHLKDFRIFWFQVEDDNVGYNQGGYRHPLIKLPLWTTMPTKILSVIPQLVQSTNAGKTVTYVGEAGEWISAWALRKQGNDKNNIYINTRRIAGDSDEAVDLYVVVEGY